MTLPRLLKVSALLVALAAFACHAESDSTALTIAFDCSDMPELKDWSERAKKDLDAFLPKLTQLLGIEKQPARTIKVIVKKDHKGSGSVAGDDVVLGGPYYQGKPDDLGTVVFLLTRSLQNYSAKNAPGWLVTGIADYIRWENYEPAERRSRIDTKNARLTNGFGDTAHFLTWLQRDCDKDIVRKAHIALLDGSYRDGFFKETAGKDAADLWKDYIASVKRDVEKEAEKAVDPTIAKPKIASPKFSFEGIGSIDIPSPGDGLTLRYTLDGSFPTAESYAFGSPVKVATSLKLRVAAFNAQGRCSEVAEMECVCTGVGDTTKPSAAINIDYSATPDLKEWTETAQKSATEFYPQMVEMLKSDGFTASRQILFVFKEQAKGLGNGTPAYSINGENTIYFHAAHIRANPKDFGMAIHEMAHVIQAYGYSRNNPSWLVEGIADFVRWENWEPVNKRRRVDPLRAKYTNGYSDTARFLTWLQTNHDKEAVTKLNAAMRKGTYSDAQFKTLGGKELAELWKDFVESLKK